jgi:hypothetical protein
VPGRPRHDRVEPAAGRIPGFEGGDLDRDATPPGDAGLFGSVAVALVGLVAYRSDLEIRLARTWPAGVPVLTDAAERFAGYLAAERDLGRIAPDTDVDTLAAMLVGTSHLLFAGRRERPDPEAVGRVVATVVAMAAP